MKEIKSKILYLVIGFLFCLILFFSINAWKPVTAMGGGAVSPVAITCSSDGKIIYVSDIDGVQKSEDFGKSWNYVLTK